MEGWSSMHAQWNRVYDLNKPVPFRKLHFINYKKLENCIQDARAKFSRLNSTRLVEAQARGPFSHIKCNSRPTTAHWISGPFPVKNKPDLCDIRLKWILLISMLYMRTVLKWLIKRHQRIHTWDRTHKNGPKKAQSPVSQELVILDPTPLRSAGRPARASL